MTGGGGFAGEQGQTSLPLPHPSLWQSMHGVLDTVTPSGAFNRLPHGGLRRKTAQNESGDLLISRSG